MIMQSALWVALSLAIIAMIDVPWQKHSFTKRMRMTKQEVKDEYKQMEGSPEVKAQIRRRQREMANSRMMQRIKDADVVITNPEHFAVALEYDPTGDGAPIMVAKGSDHMACTCLKRPPWPVPFTSRPKSSNKCPKTCTTPWPRSLPTSSAWRRHRP
jgi:flagellar biosynthetic protein FlhB